MNIKKIQDNAVLSLLSEIITLFRGADEEPLKEEKNNG